MEKLYESVRVTHYDWATYENFLFCLDMLEHSSSPGFPYNQDNPTIGGWLGYDGLMYDPERVQLLWFAVQRLIEEEEIDALWRVFIKKEPHKLTKAENNRWRLIMCCPLDVQVLWQMLFSKMNNREIQQAIEIPSIQGMRIPYGGWKLYYRKWVRDGTTMGADMTAWDWTFRDWMLELDLELRRRLTTTDNDWYTQAQKLYRNAFQDCKLLLSSGRVFQQVQPGLMKSGCVNTISSNSHAQVMLHILYSIRKGISVEPMVFAVGDDTLKHPMHLEDLSMYERFGVKIKTVSETLEFLGREWNEEGMRPMYTSKHLFKLMTQKDDLLPETLDSYLREYVNAPLEYDLLEKLVRELSLESKVHSREYYKFWLDNPLAETYNVFGR
uniref:RNA-directed RNA polymerase C-terminal domain-containing protein n=1 Tax=Riboviria sp. TaxID=2585031 RepID=A0A8K1WSK2_9VIRU|nr:MAG: hypothetical protein 1 [Riboviria sp.]